MTAALALSALPSASQSTPAPVILRVAAGLTDGTTPLLYAQSTGMFARAGITVELQRPQGGAATAAAVVGGALEIGKSSPFELFSAHVRGVPLVWIAPSTVYNGGASDEGMIVLKGSTIRTGRDLNGKTIATTVLGDLNTIATRAWIDQNGGASSTVHFVELPPATIPKALEAGRVDAATTLNPIF